jgi:LacI family transcriptional regulator
VAAGERSTIQDVARAARVHPSTVSRVLNARPELLLRVETRERVVAAAERLGYRPSVLARSLRLRRTLTLGMLVPDIANPFFPPIIKGAEDVAHERGYTLVLCNTADVPEREATYLRVLRERQVDGALIASTRMADATITGLRADGFPFVLVNRATRGSSDLAVTVDNRHAAGEAIAHLAALGHRRIAQVAGPHTTATGAERVAGARRALLSRGLDASVVVEAEAWSESAGYRAARRLLIADPPTAIFGANDLIALGVLRAAREAGLRVPDDLSVVGFNDIGESALIDLTTVHVPQEEMGAAAARLLIGALEREPIAERRVVLAARMVVRGSTAAPRLAALEIA